MSIEDKVKRIIADKLSVDLEEVVPEASFVDDLGADSLDLVELIMSMEEEFDIEIPDEKASCKPFLRFDRNQFIIFGGDMIKSKSSLIICVCFIFNTSVTLLQTKGE